MDRLIEDNDDELLDISEQNGVLPTFRASAPPRSTPSPRSITPVNSSGREARAITPVNSPQYEEFFGGSVPCPTCRGSGRIPREKENELVALIPMNDKRLAPRRTTLYVLLAVLTCLIVGGLIAFFLFPRGVQLLSNSPLLVPTRLYVNKSQAVLSMELVNEYNITNRNFYGISVHNLSLSVTFDDHVLSTGLNDTVLRIPLRSTLLYRASINITFSGDEGYIAYYCSNDVRRSHTLLLPFQADLKTSYFGGIMENTITTYQHVRCTDRVSLG